MKILITTSGIGSRLGNITQYINKSLVKIGDKLAIDYIIDSYKHLPNVEFVITLGYKGDLVKQYLTLAYPNFKIHFVYIDKYKGLGTSLGYSLLYTKDLIQEPFIFHCCDSIIKDKIVFNFDHNTLFVSDKYGSTQFSTINIGQEFIKKINNKGADAYDFVYIGVAYIKDYELFWQNLQHLYNLDKTNTRLSDIHSYKAMLLKTNFKPYLLKDYYDIGNQTAYNDTLKHFKKKYNVLFKLDESISFLDDKVIKFFYDKDVNKKRMERMKYLGNNIPKIFNFTDNFHSMELINSKPLSEIYKNGLIYKLLNWATQNLWINKNESTSFSNTCYKFYYDKTMKRIGKFIKNPLHIDYEIINGEQVGYIDELIKKVDFNNLSNINPTYFHGDFILDNILLRNNEFCLIDWRQGFGDCIEKGDKYYDLAKLRHNIYFNHDNILNDLFFIKQTGNNKCILDLKCNFFLIKQIRDYDKFVKEHNLNLKKIEILTALIWINMAPLHKYPLSNFLFNFGKYNLYSILKTN